MKKFTVLLFGILINFSVFAQKGTELFNEDFSNGVPPTGWTIDDMASQWSQSSSTNAGGTAPEARLAYITGTHTTRLISPETDLTGLTSVIFSFRHFLDDYSGSGYTIGVATRSGGGSWTDAWTVSPTGNIGPETNDIIISNSDVGTSDFQICIYLSGNMYNFDYWYIDDLILIAPDNNDAEMASINISPYAAAGNIDIECTFKNSGLNNITSIDINYQIDAGTIITENLTGLNLTTTETLDHTFATQWAATAGNYTINVWISNMNGNGDDDDTSNDLLSQPISIATQSVQNIPLYEEFTSSTCPPCATFNTNTFTPFMNAHPDDITVIKYQMSWPAPGDPYYTAEGGTRRSYYGVSFVPDLYAGGVNTATTSTGVNNAYTHETNKPAFFDITSSFTPNGTNITVGVDIMPYITADFKVHIVVIEKLTDGNVGNNGETEFHNVMMKMLPNADGTTINFVTGTNSSYSETYDMSSTFVEEMSDLAVVVFIQNDDTKEIFQSAYSELILLAPIVTFYPTDGATDVDFLSDVVLTFNHQTMRLVDDNPITNDNVSDFVHLSDPSKGDLTFTASVNGDQSVITITPDVFFTELTDITVTIDNNEIENVQDLSLTGESATFTTGEYPAAAVDFNPTDESTNVDISTNITLTFDQPMRKLDDSEITNEDISNFVSLTDPSKGNIAYTGTINAGKTIITLDPDENLPELTDITVTISAGAVENEYDVALDESTATFTTEDAEGISELPVNFKVYPNPAKNIVFISNAKNSIVTITEIYGKSIFKQVVNSNLQEINIKNFNSGLYIITIEFNDYKSEKKLIIIN